MDCTKPHTYAIEIIGATARYVGTDMHAAISALCTVDTDAGEEGYSVAEHDGIYCHRESERVELAAMLALVSV